MDSHFNGFSNPQIGFDLNDCASSHQYPCFRSGYNSLDLNLMDFQSTDPVDPTPTSISRSEVDFPEDCDFSDTVSKYIGQMLMEEEMEEKSCMFHDPLALQAAEKSFYEVLSGRTPLFPETQKNCSSNYGCSNWNSSEKSMEHVGSIDDIHVDYKHPSLQSSFLPLNYPFQSFSQTPVCYSNNTASGGFNGLVVDSPVSSLLGPNSSNHKRDSILQFNRGIVERVSTFHDSQMQFRRGVKEATKFLPCENRSVFDFENYRKLKEDAVPEVAVKVEKGERDICVSGRRSKNRLRDYIGIEEGRCSKQLAVNVKDDELSEMFDRVLLCPEGPYAQQHAAAKAVPVVQKSKAGSLLQKSVQSLKFHAGCGGRKKQEQIKEAVDLRALLLLCARAVSSDDRKNADELLKQIMQHSSPFGDGCERFAHYFASALLARLDGTGVQLYTSWASKKTSAADTLKAYQVYLLNCPFTRFAIHFANHNILSLGEKEKSLHIIDFGILYGFQWPIIIEHLSKRPGGPPRLRITGIELPQPGLRPAERVNQTGLRLAKYCEHFNVPFEYNAIVQKWETIKIEDLKISRDEKIAVNCLFRLKNLLDETVVRNSPRNAVLKLVRKINPDIFIHSVVNGSYNAPFFVTRFREAIFHFSSLYDMFDAILARENQERLMFEREFYGREAMNVIACEDSERVERPETYKQWQVRNKKAGFKQLPLDRELVKIVRAMVKAGYHKDFVIDEDGHWMLQGWRGRIYSASSCWVSAQKS